MQNPKEALQTYVHVLDGHVQLLSLGIRTRRAGGKQHRLHVKCACDTFSKDTAQDSPPIQVDSLSLHPLEELPLFLPCQQHISSPHFHFLPTANILGSCIKAESPKLPSALAEGRICFSLTCCADAFLENLPGAVNALQTPASKAASWSKKVCATALWQQHC